MALTGTSIPTEIEMLTELRKSSRLALYACCLKDTILTIVLLRYIDIVHLRSHPDGTGPAVELDLSVQVCPTAPRGVQQREDSQAKFHHIPNTTCFTSDGLGVQCMRKHQYLTDHSG